MNISKKLKKSILAFLLVMSMTFSSFSASFVLAEDESGDGGAIAGQDQNEQGNETEAMGDEEEGTDTEENSEQPDVEIQTGDVQVDINVTNIINSDILDLNEEEEEDTPEGEGESIDADADAEVINTEEEEPKEDEGDEDSESGDEEGGDAGDQTISDVQDADQSLFRADGDSDENEDEANDDGSECLINLEEIDAYCLSLCEDVADVTETVDVTETADTIETADVADAENVVETGDIEDAEDAGETMGAEDTEDNKEYEECLLICHNEAVLLNDITGEANTGDNAIENSGGDALIETGDADLSLEAVNIINSNIAGTNFHKLIFNIFDRLESEINLSKAIKHPLEVEVETDEFLNIINNNIGDVENNILINATTGGNSIFSGHGNARINTGDINISVNVLNIVNSNIAGSNFILLVINVFEDWDGDLVLPGKQVMIGLTDEEVSEIENETEEADEAEEYDEGLNNEEGENCGIVTSNQADIENEINVYADTGLNEAINNGGASINTGNANVENNVFNIANSNISLEKWMWMNINIFEGGSWGGNIFSLPSGYTINQNQNSISISSFGNNSIDSGETENECENAENGDEEETEEENVCENDANSYNSLNSGTVRNNIDINAFTGNNSINNGGEAVINSGDANIFNNVFNLVNTNVNVDNWFLGMVNIFGRWKGDVAFGRPDLWVGGTAETASGSIQPGSLVTYTLSYFNNGDADASEVVLVDDYDENYLSIFNSEFGNTNVPGQILWDIGIVSPGESGSVSYSAYVNSQIPVGRTEISNTASINGFEDDGNDEDNTETLLVVVDVAPPPPVYYSMVKAAEVENKLPDLNITRTSDIDGFVYLGEEINHKIILTNEGDGSAFDVIVYDILTYEDSEDEVKNNTWNLGEVFPGEKIEIEYTVTINGGVLPGIYRNIAFADGFDSNNDLIYSPNAIESFEVRIKEEIIEEEEVAEEKINEENNTAPAPKEIKKIDYQEDRILAPLIPEVKAATDVLESDSDKPEEEIFKGGEEEMGMFDQWWFPWLVWLIALALIIFLVWYNRKRKKKIVS